MVRQEKGYQRYAHMTTNDITSQRHDRDKKDKKKREQIDLNTYVLKMNNGTPNLTKTITNQTLGNR